MKVIIHGQSHNSLKDLDVLIEARDLVMSFIEEVTFEVIVEIEVDIFEVEVYISRGAVAF